MKGDCYTMTTTNKNSTNLVKVRFLAELVLIQQDTAPVSLLIGATIDGFVHPEYIVIKEAPQKLIRAVDELADKYGLFYSLGPSGLLINFEAARETNGEE